MNGLPRLTRLRPAPAHGIVHLGLGAFFRSHGSLVIEDAIASGGGDWGITGVSLRSPDIRDRLVPQDCAYTAVEMAPAGRNMRSVGVVRDVLFAPENAQALLELMAHPSTRIVTLTVTEKGYCHVPSSGVLNHDHPDVQHDVSAALPRSAIGYIVRALQSRRNAGLRPFTVVSCDNLPDNGRVARNVVTGLAQLLDPDLAEWIGTEGCFPSTMVDRIVPAVTETSISDLAAETGMFDAAPVFHEPFLQWVIEDHFVDGQRPAFEAVAGVRMVTDVAPFEAMKIRMLNGTHSALAYLGYLAGYETISDTVAEEQFREYAKHLWSREIIPTIDPPQDTDLSRYADDLLARYENPAIRHRTWQIAMDGSQKLPQRILGTISDNVSAGRDCDGLCLAVAAWMRYVGGIDEAGLPIDVRDPLAESLRALSDGADGPEAKARALLGVSDVFGKLINDATGRAITNAFVKLHRSGAARCVEELIAKN